MSESKGQMTELDAYKAAYLKLKEGMTIFGDRMYTEGHRIRAIKSAIKESNEILMTIKDESNGKKEVKKKVSKKKVSKKNV
jgi:hypothetical protein